MNNETPLSEIVFSKRGYKLLLFVASYILAVLALLLIFSIQGDNIQSGASLIPGLYVFPVGFVYVLQILFPNSEIHNLGFYIGWTTYLIITICAVVIRNRRISRILYFIFVLLLILNIYGCTSASN